jgi:excisionase family DNA binding protein
MARRYDCRRVKINRSYTVAEAAKLLDVHKHTVSRWIATGLPLVVPKRPFLIHGSDLRAFLAAQRPRKQPCRAGEIYCVRCRAQKRPAGDMVDYIPQTSTIGLLRGICPTCDLLIHRVAKFATLAAAWGDLNVTHQFPQQRLVDSPSPAENVDFRKEQK